MIGGEVPSDADLPSRQAPSEDLSLSLELGQSSFQNPHPVVHLNKNKCILLEHWHLFVEKRKGGAHPISFSFYYTKRLPEKVICGYRKL